VTSAIPVQCSVNPVEVLIFSGSLSPIASIGKFTATISLHFHLQLQFKEELFHIYFTSYGSVGNKRKNFTKKVDNPTTRLAAWHSRKRFLFGWCLIANNLGLSQIVYSVSMDDTPKQISISDPISTFSILMEKQTRLNQETSLISGPWRWWFAVHYC